MSRNLARPFLPIPPAEYQQNYMTEIVRSLSVYFQAQQNPGEGRHTQMVFTALQTNDQGLETGALFEQDGFVKITKANTPHVAGNSASGFVGEVTVSTP